MSLFYRRGGARIRPWPYDAVLNGTRVMLLNQDKNEHQLVSQRPPDQSNVVPTDYGEDARSPLHGRNYTWDTLHLGMGQRVEPPGGKPSGRYRHAIGMDASVSGRPGMPGPDIATFSPTTKDAQPVNRFFELGGNLYWLNGRYLIRRDSDGASTVVQDLGAAKVARDVAVYGPNTGSASFAYIAMGDTENVWRYDGATAVQHAGTLKALAFAVRGRDLHRAVAINQVSTVNTNSDPWTEANWAATNQFYIGDKSSAITRLATFSQGTSGPGGSDFLVAIKTDGLYTVNEAGEDAQYFPYMKFAPRADNGETMGYFLNDLYVRMGETLYKIDPNMGGEEIGPEKYGTLDPLMQGRITAFAGHGSFHAYAGLYNHVDGVGYLFKFGAHEVAPDGTVNRVEAWHGSISQAFTGKRITALYKTSVGAPTDHTRMYLGFSDGTIGWFVLPCVPDPAACDQYRYTTVEGSLSLSDWHAGFRANDKMLVSATVAGEQLDAGQYARLAYQADREPSAHDMGAHFDQTPRETIDFPDDVSATVLGLTLYTASDATDDAPLVTSVSVRWRLQTDLQLIYQMVVAAHDGMTSRDGTPLRTGAERIRETCRALVSSPRAYEVILPDQSTKRISFFDIQEKLGYDARFGKWREGIQLSGIEERTVNVYGTYSRLDPLTYGDLDPLTYGDLDNL